MTRASDQADVTIIGAGPAGMSAALRAASQGYSVIVLDEQARVGGQIFRQSPRDFEAAPSPAYKLYPFGKKLVEQAEENKTIDWRFRHTVWGIFQQDDGFKVCSGSSVIQSRAVIVATGAYELPVAFPGWTKPGVMGVGAIQTLVKSQHVLPGRKFVLAGSHPLLLLVADLLCKAGAEVLEVAIARPRPRFFELLAGLPAIPGNLPVFRESARALANVMRHRVPVRFGRIIAAAHGNAGLERVTIADCDSDWRVVGGHQDYEADILGIGYGLLASTELCRQAGCATKWSPRDGGWIVAHDGMMRTNVPGLYVAGEPAGIRGAQSAAAEGELAAETLSLDLGAPGMPKGAISAAQRKIKTVRRFSDTVSRFFEPRLDGLAELAVGDTLICRCEEVSGQAVVDFLDANPHVTNVNSVKLACRTGMGFCQGRYCQHSVAQILARRRGVAASECGTFKARTPVKPVTIGTLASIALDAAGSTLPTNQK